MAQTTSDDHIDDLLGRAVEEYFEQMERGEQVQLETFVERYPQISDVLMKVIPAFERIEPTSNAANHSSAKTQRPKQLGDFRILRQIGRGGMGVVYEAEQISMNRRVALKVLPLAGLVDEARIRRFQNEVRAVAALDHPNIVSVYMVGEERGVHYYAMQLIRGRSLSEVIASLQRVDEGEEALDGASMSRVTAHGRLDDDDAAGIAKPIVDAATAVTESDPPPTNPEPVETIAAESSTIPHSSRREYFRSVVALGIQAASALQHAHDEGVIHRDIKPANFLLDRSAKLYLTDFGLARIEAGVGVTMTGDLIGTLRYMAPEQALAKRVLVDHRADVYSLGATLYELLALRPAYLAEDRQDLLKQIAFEEPTPLRHIDRDIPADLETIVHKVMSKDMNQRYASAHELADDLRAHLDNRPIKAKPPTVSEIIGKWTRRNLALTWAAIITLSLVTITLVASSLLISKQLVIAQTRYQEAEAARRAETRLRQTTQHRAYASAMQVVQSVWEHSAFQSTNLLNAQRPEATLGVDLRNFEWHYWARKMPPAYRVLHQHTDVVYDVTYSPDGQLLATAGLDECVCVWRADTGQVLRVLKDHGKVHSVAFSPDGESLASAGPIGLITLRSWDTGRVLRAFSGHTHSIDSVAFSHDGHLLASTSEDCTVRLWDVKTGHSIHTLDCRNPGAAVAFSPDDRRVAAGTWGRDVLVWDTASGALSATIRGHKDGIEGVEFSSDGTRLATAGRDSSVRVFDAVKGIEVLTLKGHGGWVQSVRWSADDKELVTASNDGTCRVWDAETGVERLSLRGHESYVRRAVFSPDGQSVVSVSNDQTLRFWKKDIAESSSLFCNEESRYFCLTSDGRLLLAARPGAAARLTAWDMDSAQLIWQAPGGEGGVTLRPDGRHVASGDPEGNVRVYEVRTGEQVFSFVAEPGGFQSLTYSPDGKLLATNGNRYALRSRPTSVKVWNAETGESVAMLTAQKGWVEKVVFSPDGKLMVTPSHDRSVKIWNTDNWELRQTLLGHTAQVVDVAYSPTQPQVASVSYDATVRIWDVRSGQCVHVMRGHTGNVLRVAYSPDGQRVATGSINRQVKVWDVRTGQELLSLPEHTGEVSGIAFSVDGYRLLSASRGDSSVATLGGGHAIRIWDATPNDGG